MAAFSLQEAFTFSSDKPGISVSSKSCDGDESPEDEERGGHLQHKGPKRGGHTVMGDKHTKEVEMEDKE